MGRSCNTPNQESTPPSWLSAASDSSSPAGSPTFDGSCVSSEAAVQDGSGREATTSSMVLLGCTRCLMYVMLSRFDLKCPRCKSTALLDFFSSGKRPPAPPRGLVDMSSNVSTGN